MPRWCGTADDANELTCPSVEKCATIQPIQLNQNNRIIDLTWCALVLSFQKSSVCCLGCLIANQRVVFPLAVLMSVASKAVCSISVTGTIKT